MARKKKPQITIENLHIDDFASEGKCVTRHNDKVIFVQNAAPGDVVDIQITRDKKSYAEGKAVKFHKRSEKRIEPFCSHYGACGGCKWQHLSYEAQTRFKQKTVLDALERLGHVNVSGAEPILGSAETQYYRNKLEFTFRTNVG